MDPKTVLGFYISSFNTSQGAVMFYVLNAVTIIFFISLSTYVDAFFEDFKTIIEEMNDEMKFDNTNSSRPQRNKNRSTAKITEAILLHYDMLKYLSILLRIEVNTDFHYLFSLTVSWKIFAI